MEDFAVHVGENDNGVKRNEATKIWKEKYDKIKEEDPDPDAYIHVVKLHEGKGHWMDLDDREALPWMKQFTRNPLPKIVVWHQDGQLMPRLYWLAVNIEDVEKHDTIRAEREGQKIMLKSDKPLPVRVRLNDMMLNLDKPVEIKGEGYKPFQGKVNRTITMLATSLQERGDPASLFVAEVEMHPAE